MTILVVQTVCMFCMVGQSSCVQCTRHYTELGNFSLLSSNYVPLILKEVLRMQFDTEILAMKKMRNEIGMVLIVCYCLIPAKGQLISKYPFGIIVWKKYQRNYF